jgi:O-antigen ligase
MSPPILAALLWLAAFICSLSPTVPHEFWMIGCLIFGFAALAVLFDDGLRQGLNVPRSPIVIFAVLFWINAVASIFWSDIPVLSAQAVIIFSLFPLTFLVTATMRGDVAEKFFRLIAWGLGAFMGALAAWALLQFFVLRDLLVYGQPRYPFADPNNYAILMVMAVFPALSALLCVHERGKIMALSILCALLLSAIMVMGSRGAYITLGGGLVLFFLLTFLPSKKGGRIKDGGKRLAVPILSALITIAFLFTTVPENRVPIARMTTIAEQGLGVFSERLIIWEATKKIIEERPILGHGYGTFSSLYPAARSPKDWFSGGYNAHNDPLQFWAETGVLGIVLFYAVCGAAIVRMVRFYLQRHSRESRNPVSSQVAGLFCALSAIIASIHWTPSLYCLPVMMTAGVMLGAWVKATHIDDTNIVVKWEHPARSVLIILPFLAVIFFMQGMLRSQYHVLQARQFIAAGDMEKFGAAVNHADKTGFGLNANAYLLAAAIPLGILEGGNKTLSADEKNNLSQQAIKLLDHAERLNRFDADLYYHRALAGQDKEKNLRRALVLDPQHLSSRMALADLLMADDIINEAFEILKEGMVWRYRLIDPAPYYSQISALALEFGDMETQNDALLALSKIYSEKRLGK